MKRSNPIFSIGFFCLLTTLSLVVLTGCGGKKKPVKTDYGKPTWLKVDKSQLTPLSEDATNLEGGKITVYDPEGWERQPRGAAKAPKGFKSVIVFKKDAATILMTKSEKAKDLPDLDADNIEDFADNAQQLFKSKVQMLKLGALTGVYFAKRVADAQRMSKFYDRRIVATAINGELFTFELIADKGKIDKAALNALFAVISKTEIEGMEPEATDSAPEEHIETVAAAEPPAVDKPKEEPAVETKPEPKEEPKVETAAAPAPIVDEPKVEEPKVEVKPEPVVEVAATPKPEPKVEPPKPAAKPAAKKTAPKKKADTKAILNELDALLN